MTTPVPIPPRVEHNKSLYERWMAAHGIDPRIPLLQAERLPAPTTDPVGIIDLPNVTLWSAFEHGEDRAYLDRVIRVLRYMNRFCRFKTTRLLSHLDPGPSFEFEWIRVDKVPSEQLSAFLNQVAPQHLLDSDFAFSVHEDGFILYPEMWDPAFLEYDYIGAPWLPLPGTVGNGGFYIESRAMLEAKLRLPKDTSNPLIWADQYVCITHRARLESEGLRFAPVSLAGKFSVDLLNRTRKSFGFHGKRIVPLRQAYGWARIEESEKVKMDNPKIEIVYVYWAQDPEIERFSKRFVDTYFAHPPGKEHITTIVCNGGQPIGERRAMFDRLPNVTYLDHDNSGWDIGAYQHAARKSVADMIVFFGLSIHFRRQGWLIQMVDTFRKHGNAQYGAMGHRGELKSKVWPHIRTTAFWMTPALMNSYPWNITQSGKGGQRYEFEHGEHCFTDWVTKQGLQNWVITWIKELLLKDCDSDPNGYQQGDQSSLLALDNRCEPPYFTEKKSVL